MTGVQTCALPICPSVSQSRYTASNVDVTPTIIDIGTANLVTPLLGNVKNVLRKEKLEQVLSQLLGMVEALGQILHPRSIVLPLLVFLFSILV